MKKKRLGIDVRILSQPMSGVGRYVCSLIESLRAYPEFDIVLFTDTPVRDEHKDACCHHPIVMIDNLSQRKQWRSKILPKQLKNHNIDLYHATWDKGIPYNAPCPMVMAIHDLYCIAPENEYLTVLKKKKRQWDLLRETKSCQKVFTISESTKNDIVEKLNVLPEKITITYLDCDRERIDKSLNKNISQSKFCSFLDNEKFFISVVGRLSDKRKNIPFLLNSFSKFIHRAKNKRSDYKLLLVGDYSVDSVEFAEFQEFAKEHQLENNIVLTGYLTDAEMYQLMKKSLGLVFVSLFEGFGIPILESFYVKAPVITSNRYATAEVAGNDSAILVDPAKEELLADAMAKLVLDKTCSRELVEKGSQRLQNFSWNKTAAKIVNTYKEVINDS